MRATTEVRAAAPAVRRAHLLGAVGAVLAVASVVLTAHGRVLLHQCVVADGPLAAFGVRLAVLRSAVECPDGALGLGAASQGAVVLLSVAVPVAAAHVLLAACGLGLGIVARRGWAAVAALLAAGLLPRVAPAGLPVLREGRRTTSVTDLAVHVRRDRGHDPARPRRGPPGR